MTFVLFRFDVTKVLDSHIASCKNNNETGGILIGSLRKEDIELTAISLAGPKDISQRYAFIKQDPLHQLMARLLWKKSQYQQTYMGEWHTHPSGLPIPSETDRQTWKAVAKEQNRNMVFVIVSPSGWAGYLSDPQGNISTLELHEKGEVSLVFED